VAQPVPGTEGTGPLPFWSPDSRSIAFTASGKLNRVELAGGTVATICALPGPEITSGTWNRDGAIVFACGLIRPLYQVSASGGEPRPLTQLDVSRGEVFHRFPFFLPDGRHFVFEV